MLAVYIQNIPSYNHIVFLLYTAADRPHFHELISLKKQDGSKLEVTNGSPLMKNGIV